MEINELNLQQTKQTTSSQITRPKSIRNENFKKLQNFIGVDNKLAPTADLKTLEALKSLESIK